jgi:hypothetical protein
MPPKYQIVYTQDGDYELVLDPSHKNNTGNKNRSHSHSEKEPPKKGRNPRKYADEEDDEY